MIYFYISPFYRYRMAYLLLEGWVPDPPLSLGSGCFRYVTHGHSSKVPICDSASNLLGPPYGTIPMTIPFSFNNIPI